MNNQNPVVAEHFQVHAITEIEHFPEHGKRTETLEFRNAKHELEQVEHLGCFVCGTMEHRESHHIFERAFWNGLDVSKVAFYLYNHFDFHGHCKRDFKSHEELLKYFIDHFNGKPFEYYIEVPGGHSGPFTGYTCDDEAADTIYNQLILCTDHHRGMGTGVHGTTTPTFFAWLAHKDGYMVSMDPKQFKRSEHQ